MDVRQHRFCEPHGIQHCARCRLAKSMAKGRPKYKMPPVVEAEITAEIKAEDAEFPVGFFPAKRLTVSTERHDPLLRQFGRAMAR